jgi:histidinol-phosphate aminotransferase
MSARVIKTREVLVTALDRLGFETLPSTANFVFTRHPKHAGATLYQQLRERGIIVRHFKAPRIDAFLRITIGTDEQNQELIGALEELVQ